MKSKLLQRTSPVYQAGLAIAIALLMLCETANGQGFKTKEKAMVSPGTENTKSKWEITPLITIGETDEAGNNVNLNQFNHDPVGILDGIAAFKSQRGKVKVLVNNEFGANSGYPYQLENETMLKGARITYFEVGASDRSVYQAGIAYERIFDREGKIVTDPSQINEGAPGSSSDGFDRFCSANGIESGKYGFVNPVYFAGEETSGGQECALDVFGKNLYVVPMLGRAAWENVSPVENFNSNKVVLLIGDDRGGSPLILYIGERGKSPSRGYNAPDFLTQNGLGYGHLYVWKATNNDRTPSAFKGTGASREGYFLRIDHFYPNRAGMEGYDNLGFVSQEMQDNLADFFGAFKFSRPEDVAVNPKDGTQLALCSTGLDNMFPNDSWGTTYLIDIDDANFSAQLQLDIDEIDVIPANIKILYDGDDAGAGQFSHPDYGLRSPDNLCWANDGNIYIQEDRSIGEFGITSGLEASVWKLNPSNGILTCMAQIDRTAVPLGQTDNSIGDIGNWESSGILDVSGIFGKKRDEESIFLMDVQAHSLRDGLIGGSASLVQGGQLLLISVKQDASPTKLGATETNATFNSEITDEQGKELILFPNPVKDLLQISFVPQKHKQLANIHIYNTAGELVFSKQLSDDSQLQLSTSNYMPGIYVVNVIYTDNTYVKRKLIIE